MTIIKNKLMTEDLFTSLSNESEQPNNRKFSYAKTPILEKMVNVFNNFYSFMEPFNILEQLKHNLNFPYETKDIRNFCIYSNIFFENYQFSYRLGCFLTALITNSNDKEIIINTNHLKSYPNFLGMFNKDKTIYIDGNVGDSCGYAMRGGKIIINGNAGYSLGRTMSGGDIMQIDSSKSVNNYTGLSMYGGKIFIFGKANDNIGHNMHNGEIHIYSNSGFVSRDFYKGLILKNKQKDETYFDIINNVKNLQERLS